MTENELSHAIVGAAIEVHRLLGPGLLESVYEAALAKELAMRKLDVERQQAVPVDYKGERLEVGFRLDLIVNDLVVIEVKAAERILPIHEMQLLTYLRLAGKKLGLLLNFNTLVMKDGVRRVVNNL